MATLSNKNGNRMVQFGRKRQTIYLGKMSKVDGALVRSHIQHLANAKAHALPIPTATAAWLNEIDDVLHERISRVGLVDLREHVTSKASKESPFAIETVIDKYIANRSDLKPSTKSNLNQAKRVMVAFFGSQRDVRKINNGDAADWRRDLEKTLAQATIAMHVKKARQIFADAQDRNMIQSNPFAKVRAGTQKNRSRWFYVPRSDIAKAIDACPDIEWKLIFALTRYAGLRMPSEVMKLRWENVLWDENRIKITSPKTEHLEDREHRIIPLFPELRPLLLEALERAKDGAEFVISTHRDITNLRTRAVKIVDRSGVKPWPKLFQNLRASCETDLTATFPLHIACEWIGNSEAVALSSYLHATDADFDQATGAVKSAAEGRGTQGNKRLITNRKTPDFRGFSTKLIPPRGAESYKEFKGNLNDIHTALQNALHSATERLHAFDAKSLEALSRQIQSAKGAA